MGFNKTNKINRWTISTYNDVQFNIMRKCKFKKGK
nr:MAG TPA: hypothetical protein [Caudoviricetes sp.]